MNYGLGIKVSKMKIITRFNSSEKERFHNGNTEASLYYKSDMIVFDVFRINEQQ